VGIKKTVPEVPGEVVLDDDRFGHGRKCAAG
jgi:hypothetical protein